MEVQGPDWSDFYGVEVKVIGLENYYNNGRAVYIVQRKDGTIYNGVS